MSEASEAARKAMKDKAARLTASDPGEKVDASSWEPPEPLNTEAKTGLRPISKRAYRRGGKIGMMADGAKAKTRADRKPRKSGGSVADEFVNRNVKTANAELGKPHIGGYKKGGDARAKKAAGGQMVNPQALSNASLQNAAGVAGVPQARMGFAGRSGTPLPLKSGGRAHPDEAEDKKLIDHMVKKEARKPGMKKGGAADGKWIAGAIKHPGALHRELGVKAGEKIPAKKLEKATHSKNPTEAKRARLAETLKGMHKASGGAAGHPADCGCGKCGGGRVGRKEGGMAPNYEGGTRPTGGREARANGGRTGKGKMNVNIVIAQPSGGAQQPQSPIPPQQPPAHPIVAPPMPPQMPMGGMPAGMPPQMGAAPPMPGGMPMARKDGGRTYRSYKDMDAGGLSGLGRLEKTEIQEHKR